MKEIDWSKAPEGATHFDSKFGLFCTSFGWWSFYGDFIADRDQNEWGTERYIERPGRQWNGTGLPPVGAKVILSDANHDVFEPYKEMIGVEVTVVASFASPAGFDMIACALPDGLCGCFRADMARPLRTPEQIAAEERERAISEMLRIYTDGAAGHCGGIAALYDAGYRRQEPKE